MSPPRSLLLVRVEPEAPPKAAECHHSAHKNAHSCGEKDEEETRERKRSRDIEWEGKGGKFLGREREGLKAPLATSHESRLFQIGSM